MITYVHFYKVNGKIPIKIVFAYKIFIYETIFKILLHILRQTYCLMLASK